MFYKHKPYAGGRNGRKMPFLSLVIFTFDLDLQRFRARDQLTRLPCEFGANPFSGSRDISHPNKKVTDSAKNRTVRSSLYTQ